jgi:hypothetical protein
MDLLKPSTPTLGIDEDNSDQQQPQGKKKRNVTPVKAANQKAKAQKRAASPKTKHSASPAPHQPVAVPKSKPLPQQRKAQQDLLIENYQDLNKKYQELHTKLN